MSHRGTPYAFVEGDLVRFRCLESAEDVQRRAPPKRYRVVGRRTRPPFAASREEICIRACGEKSAIWCDPMNLEKIPETLDDLEQAMFEPVASGPPLRSSAPQCCALQ